MHTKNKLSLDHHAQLIEGDITSLRALLNLLDAELGITSSHPDLLTFVYTDQKLGIDESHIIRDAILKNPAAGKHTYIVIYAYTLTETAQNALLKITEEPPAHAKIFLITEFIPHILPTLRSRFVLFDTSLLDIAGAEALIQSERDAAGDKARLAAERAIAASVSVPGKRVSKKVTASLTKEKNLEEDQTNLKKTLLNVDQFLNSNMDNRLRMVKEIHGAMDKEVINVTEVWNFVHNLEKALMEDIHAHPTPNDVLRIEAMASAQQYLHSPGNSVKMLLEFLAIRI